MKTSKNKKLFIWGWWQGHNLGDNWIRKTLESLFPEATFVDTTVKKFEKGSFVICGGGGLFIYDVIAPWNCPQKNISYGMLGLGAEFPHDSRTAVSVCQNAKFFYVRDQYSLDCMHINNVARSYDITFALPLRWVSNSEQNKNKVFFVWRDGHELLSNPKFNAYIQAGSCYAEWKSLISHRFESVIEDDFQTNENDIETRIADCGFVVSGRYHGIIAAIQKGLPFLAIDICPKIRALLEDCGLSEYCIKISEISKAPRLIDKALKEIDLIREKEQKFVAVANQTLCKQVENARLEIMKSLHPPKIIPIGWKKRCCEHRGR